MVTVVDRDWFATILATFMAKTKPNTICSAWFHSILCLTTLLVVSACLSLVLGFSGSKCQVLPGLTHALGVLSENCWALPSLTHVLGVLGENCWTLLMMLLNKMILLPSSFIVFALLFKSLYIT